MNVYRINSIDRVSPHNQDVKKKKESDNELFKSAFEKVRKSMQDNELQSGETQEGIEEKISKKIKNGEKLSKTELSYIEKTNPTLYTQVLKLQSQRENLEHKLKNSKSKKEVEDICNQSILNIDKREPLKVPLIKAYENATNEFKKTNQYKLLTNDFINGKEKLTGTGKRVIMDNSYMQSVVSYEQFDYFA